MNQEKRLFQSKNRAISFSVAANRSHYIGYTRPGVNACILTWLTVNISGTKEVNASGNITAANFTATVSNSTYFFVTFTKTISGASVTVYYTIHAKNGAVINSGTTTGSVTLYA